MHKVKPRVPTVVYSGSPPPSTPWTRGLLAPRRSLIFFNTTNYQRLALLHISNRRATNYQALMSQFKPSQRFYQTMLSSTKRKLLGIWSVKTLYFQMGESTKPRVSSYWRVQALNLQSLLNYTRWAAL